MRAARRVELPKHGPHGAVRATTIAMMASHRRVSRAPAEPPAAPRCAAGAPRACDMMATCRKMGVVTQEARGRGSPGALAIEAITTISRRRRR